MIDSAILRRLEPIGHFPAERLDELSRLCSPETYPQGTDLMALGAVGVNFVFLLDGELRVILHDGSQRIMVGGCDQANWPIGYKTVLPQRTQAITEITLVRISFEILDVMMGWAELTELLQPAAVDASRAQDSVSNSATSAGLTVGDSGGAFSLQAMNSPHLAPFPQAHIHEVLQCFERILVRQGQSIIREGEPGDFYYLIESGRCRVIKRVGGADVELAELKSGDAFGEEALLANAPRNATVNMKTDGILLRLTKADFIRLMQVPLLQSLSRAEADARVARGEAAWLDVRYSAEASQNILPGAINIPFSEIRGAFDLLDKRQQYIVYCQTGRQSSAAAFLLAQHGFSAYWLAQGVGAGPGTATSVVP